jgi:type IV pilus assembly protein PilC
MPTYLYEAINAAGKPEKGRIEAASSDEAMAAVRQNGFFPTSVREEKLKGASKKAAKLADAPEVRKRKRSFNISIGGVKTKVLTQFTRQLSTLQDAGLPLLRSLQILEQQQKPGKLKNILLDVVEDVESGTSLSDAMSKHPKAFDRLYSKMVAAGEIGGVLDVILQRLATFMEKAERLKSRIKGAMIYPVCVIVVAIGIVTGIMYFVIPKFKDIFNDFDVT